MKEARKGKGRRRAELTFLKALRIFLGSNSACRQAEAMKESSRSALDSNEKQHNVSKTSCRAGRTSSSKNLNGRWARRAQSSNAEKR